MLIYKFDIIEALKDAGYNTTRIRKEKIISEAVLQMIRKEEMIGTKTLDKICEILDMQPGNIIKYVDTEDGEKIIADRISRKKTRKQS